MKDVEDNLMIQLELEANDTLMGLSVSFCASTSSQSGSGGGFTTGTFGHGSIGGGGGW